MNWAAWSTNRVGDELRVQLYLGQEREGKGEGFSVQQSIKRTLACNMTCAFSSGFG